MWWNNPEAFPKKRLFIDLLNGPDVDELRMEYDFKFLTDSEATVESGDVADAFALDGYFLERRIFDRQGQGMPDSRRRMIEALGHRGRL